MRYRTILVLALLAPLVAWVCITVFAVTEVIAGEATRQLQEEVSRAGRVTNDALAQRESLLRAESRVLAEEPRLRAVLGTDDVDQETIAGVAADLGAALQAQLFVVADPQGQLVTEGGAGARLDLVQLGTLVRAALASGEASGIVRGTGETFQVLVRRLAYGQATLGAVVVGSRIDHAFAEDIHAKTGAAVVFAFEGADVASARAGADVARWAARLAADPRRADGALEQVELDGEAFLSSTGSLRSSAGAPPLRFVTLRAVAEARATQRVLVTIVYVAGLIAAGAAVVLAIVVARRLARPVDVLVAVTNELARGNLDARAPAGGPHETAALGAALNRMADDIARSRDVLVRNERLEREVEIASQIQLALAPEKIVAAGLEASGATRPTESVGGDYFDVIATPDASWIAIGDVAGHGLNAGLVTLMVQCGIASAVRQAGARSPRAILTEVNRVLYENIRQRLKNDEHVTLSLLRHERGGRITFAGAHEDVLVWRARTGRCESIATNGTWLGIMEDIGGVTEDETIQLDPGDLLVLYTDGLTEARDVHGVFFGIDRLRRAIEAAATAPVEHIRDRILDEVQEWRAVQDDDETILVIRQSDEDSQV